MRWCEILGTRPSVARMGAFDFDFDFDLGFDEVGPRPEGPEGTNRISSRNGKGGKPGTGHEFSLAGFRELVGCPALPSALRSRGPAAHPCPYFVRILSGSMLGPRAGLRVLSVFCRYFVRI